MNKKIILVLLMIFAFIPSVYASNKINNMDISVYINEDGSADITEVWDVKGSDGTEWYKCMYDLGNMTISNFKVSMDGEELKYKNWDVSESLSEKKGYYGINYVSRGQELCFGKYDYKSHVFTLTYTLSNFIFNTDDSQIIYYKFIDTLSDVDFKNFKVNIKSFYEFPDTLDVWGYGYKGYAYVKDGIISMSNEGNMGSNYVVLLAKFPLNTFNTNNRYSMYSTFDSILNSANEGTFTYDYDTEESNNNGFNISYIFIIIYFLICVVPAAIGIKKFIDSGYGYKDNKKIDKKNTPMFRDIPCNKDIYYANVLVKLNNFNYKESNILGAIILKWVRNNKIVFKNEKTGIFNKETSVIDLTNNNGNFDNKYENKLYDMMYEASKDGLLETKEFEKWAKNNYEKFLDFFKDLEKDGISNLENKGLIYKRKDKSECKKQNVMDDTLYEESKKLYGLKLYLEEFSNMNTKEVMEVKLWDEYLMFAYIFGIADKVAKQLKKLYPEVIEQENIDYDTLMYVNYLSTRTVSAASSARSAAESYSSGGGGFSSGGGGGGSFGGGGGGSR